MSIDLFFDAVLRRGFVGRLETRPSPSVKEVASGFKVHEIAQAKGLRLVAPLILAWVTVAELISQFYKDWRRHVDICLGFLGWTKS